MKFVCTTFLSCAVLYLIQPNETKREPTILFIAFDSRRFMRTEVEYGTR